MAGEELIFELHKIGCIKFGEFRLKSGMVSPIYIDLRILASHPRVLRLVARELAGLVAKLEFDKIAAVPYAALPIGTALSLETDKPMIYARREAKSYGTAQLIEGVWSRGETIIVVDDLITTGESKFEVIRPLENAGLEVRDVVVVIDREQGGAEALERGGYRLHALLKLSGVLDVLEKNGKITGEQKDKVLNYIKGARV
ncbi:MAG: orotate phosphoribosyltransferase [Candidatus Micrarchaeia archaeon]